MNKDKIKIGKTQVFGLESAIRGLRNPMNSWVAKDSLIMPDDTEYWESFYEYRYKGNENRETLCLAMQIKLQHKTY